MRVEVGIESAAALRKLRELADANRMDDVLRAGSLKTLKQGRARLDRLLYPLLGFKLKEMKQLAPAYIKSMGKGGASVVTEMGLGRNIGYNFSSFRIKEVYRRGRKAGLRVLGGPKNPHAGYYPRAFVLPVSGNPVFEYLVGGHKNIAPKTTKPPGVLLREAGKEEELHEYVKERLEKNILRAMRNQYRLLNNV